MTTENDDSHQREKLANSSRLCIAAAASSSAWKGLEDLRKQEPQ